MRPGFDKFELGPHGKRAVELLEQAKGEVLDGQDAIPTLSEATANLRAEAGELSEDGATYLLEIAEASTEGT